MSADSGGGSRPSQTNCHAPAKDGEPPDSTNSAGHSHTEPGDMPSGTALRPISVDGDRALRDEALMVELEDGHRVPLTSPNVTADDGAVTARPWYRLVNEHSQWYEDYQNSHIEYENPEGEAVRAPLETSYHPEYGNRYYAKLMDLKRGVERRWNDFSIVMLTLSASTLNGEDRPRCPADHMRDIAEGWDTARKQLYETLRGENWVYAKVWEPTSEDGLGPAGYGHMHVAVFVEDGDSIRAEQFRPFMESYVANTQPAGWDAHEPGGDAVSVTHELEEANAATYISEYIGQYGEELTDRPMHERAFLAAAWATGTRRVEFSNDAQDLIAGEQFRRETGLRPQDRGKVDSDGGGAEAAESGESNGWTFRRMCEADSGGPRYYEPSDGGVNMTRLDGADGVDPPRDLGPPPR